MNITRDRSLKVTAHCRANGFKYAGHGQYPNSVKAGLKANTRAPNGVRVHYPRDSVVFTVNINEPMLRESTRVYVLWVGEPVDAIKEACAFLQSTTRGKEIYVVRCNRATCDEHHHHGGVKEAGIGGATAG